MGKRGKKTRPIKVTIPTKKSAQTIVKTKKKIQEKFTKVSVQQCMTPEERKKRKELIEHCKMKREETGFDLVIFAKYIVKRSDIPNIKTKIWPAQPGPARASPLVVHEMRKNQERSGFKIRCVKLPFLPTCFSKIF